MNIKICTKCGETKLDQIDFRIRWRGGREIYSYRGQCKECERQRENQYYNDNKKRTVHRKVYCNTQEETDCIGIIYKATNKTNGKSYIGQTISGIEKRKIAHLKASKVPKTHFHKALKKYGVDCFEWSILEKCNNLNLAEQWYVRKFDTYENGYNSTTGGSSFSGYVFTEAAKENIRKAQLKRYEDPNERLKTSIQQKKRFSDPEELKKHSIASSKEFIIIDSYLDKIYNIKNLKSYCKERCLNPGCMSWVAAGKSKSHNHKGYNCKHIPCILYKNQINNTFSLFFW